MRTLLPAFALALAAVAALPATAAEPDTTLGVTGVGDGTITLHNPGDTPVTVDAAALDTDGQPLATSRVTVDAGADTVALREPHRPFLPTIDGTPAGPPITPQPTPTLTR